MVVACDAGTTPVRPATELGVFTPFDVPTFGLSSATTPLGSIVCRVVSVGVVAQLWN